MASSTPGSQSPLSLDRVAVVLNHLDHGSHSTSFSVRIEGMTKTYLEQIFTDPWQHMLKQTTFIPQCQGQPIPRHPMYRRLANLLRCEPILSRKNNSDEAHGNPSKTSLACIGRSKMKGMYLSASPTHRLLKSIRSETGFVDGGLTIVVY